MEKWFRQILQGEHSLFRLSLPFRVRLFNVLALVGGMISLINGISSYVNNQDSVILGLNLGIAVLSFVLLFYAYKSGRYQFCYVVTIIMIFLMMFPYLFFKSGGYKGGMVSFYIFGILFTVFMLEGKVMFFTAFMEMVVYIATIMIAYQNPQMVVWFSSEKEVVMDLLIGFCAYLSKPVMWSKLEDLLMKYLRDDLVFIREDLKEEQKIKDEEFKQLKGQLKENDIKIEEGLRLLDGDFMQYRKLMEFFTEYQEEYMRQMQQLMTQKEVKVDEITRMMHTLKSNAKAIGAIHLYEIAKEMEDRGKQKDMEYIMSAYDLLKLEWRRVFKASREFIEQTKNVLFDQKKEEEKDKQSKEEIKEKLKIFITRYQAKEAKEQIQYYRKGKISEEERNILKEMEIRIDQLDFDEAEILMKRWEGME